MVWCFVFISYTILLVRHNNEQKSKSLKRVCWFTITEWEMLLKFSSYNCKTFFLQTLTIGCCSSKFNYFWSLANSPQDLIWIPGDYCLSLWYSVMNIAKCNLKRNGNEIGRSLWLLFLLNNIYFLEAIQALVLHYFVLHSLLKILLPAQKYCKCQKHFRFFRIWIKLGSLRNCITSCEINTKRMITAQYKIFHICISISVSFILLNVYFALHYILLTNIVFISYVK